MLHPRITGAFRKDRKRAHRRGKGLGKLETLMRRLANEERLEPRRRDHRLSGKWNDLRECHVEPDLAIDLSRRRRRDHIRAKGYSLRPVRRIALGLGEERNASK